MSPGRSRRRSVFDPNRLDDLDEVLSAPSQPDDEQHAPEAQGTDAALSQPEAAAARNGGPGATASPASPAEASTAAGESRRTSNDTTARRTGAGQRPAPATGRQAKSPRGRIATAVRVPSETYHQVNDRLLAGTERPSYGQLVMWTLEDHHDLVVVEVETNLPDPSARVPRGRRLAQDRVPVGLHLLGSERDQLDEVAASVSDHHGVRVTRTDVAVAALRVALAVRISS